MLTHSSTAKHLCIGLLVYDHRARTLYFYAMMNVVGIQTNLGLLAIFFYCLLFFYPFTTVWHFGDVDVLNRICRKGWVYRRNNETHHR